ncbi:hypothetical protein QBC45DRAFT_471692 [Copromyces sp. CBS 386.78]|nr:hypothetical protein QBC45DRAFT_471692 [Copromyces sp. CBS 386.78]
MLPTKRHRTTHPSSSPDSHTEKRPRVEEENDSEGPSQSGGEAPMDLASSSDSEQDMITTARPSSDSTTEQRAPLAQEGESSVSESSVSDDAAVLTTDDRPEDHDQAEDDRDNVENDDGNTGVVSWGWGDAHFLYELNPHSQARNEDESDATYSDPRIPLWQQEDRAFAGDIFQDYPEIAGRVALSASHGPLQFGQVPQLSIFCDGSVKQTSFEGWKKGGYSVAFRDPFFGTSDFVSQADPARFIGRLTIHDPQQAFSSEPQEGNENQEGLAQVTDFTVLEYATKTLSVGHVELAAISQSLEVGIMLQDEHQPEAMNIRVFTDSVTALERLEFGILPLDSDEGSFFRWSTNPLVRTIVWQSHHLYERGCSVEIRWHPRCCALGPALADAAASS